jgi:hypothetical protein
MLRIGMSSARTYFGTKDHFTRLMCGWLGVALLSVFLESQSEGRLLDEPFLYVLLAILAAVEMGVTLKERAAVVEPVRQAVSEQAAGVTAPRRVRTPNPAPDFAGEGS